MKLNVSSESLELKSWAMIRFTPPKADVNTVDFCFLVYIATVCISRIEGAILGCCIHKYFCLGHTRYNILHMKLNFNTVMVESTCKDIMSYDYLAQTDL